MTSMITPCMALINRVVGELHQQRVPRRSGTLPDRPVQQRKFTQNTFR